MDIEYKFPPMQHIVAPYFLGYLVFFVVALALLLMYPKGDLHIMLNAVHTGATDAFLSVYSKLAEWPLYVVAFLFFVYKKRYWWMGFYAVSEGMVALVITTLKHIFRMPRPSVFFGDEIGSLLPLVDGVKLHRGLSFPSGHTSTFFVFCTVGVILLGLHFMNNKEESGWRANRLVRSTLFLIILLAALLGGYSRIYLSQHFLMDVFAGSMIGLFVPFALLPVFARRIDGK